MVIRQLRVTQAKRRAVWLERNFALFLAGHFTSVLGDKLQYVALQIFVFQATGRAVDVGFLTAAELLPFLLLGMAAGWVVDRWGARRTMIAADILRAALVLAIPLVFPGSLHLLYALILGVAVGNVLSRPGRAALTKTLARRNRLVEANSAAITVENAGDVLGFLAGGLAAATLSLVGVVYINAATFVVSAVALAAIRLPGRLESRGSAASPGAEALPQPTPARRPWSGLLGLRALRADPVLWANMWVFGAAILASGGLVPLVVVYLLTVAGGSPLDFGLARGAAAAGMILGALAAGTLAMRRSTGWLISAGLAVTGLATLALPAVPAVLTAVTGLFFVGFGNMLYYVPTEALVQERADPHLVGRLYGARTAILYTALLVSTLALPAVADVTGTIPVLWASGAVLVVCAALHRSLPPLRRLQCRTTG